jgi:hypothetical protein
MSFVIADRVRETTTTIGTGTLSLDGAVVGFQAFTAVGNNNTTYYTIQGTTEWEVGIGTYLANTLSRDTVISSSSGGAKVSLSAGTKDVFVTLPAEKTVVVPASSTNHSVVRFDGTSGTVIQNSVTTIDDAGNAAGVNSITFDTTPTTVPTTEGSLYWDSADSNQTLSLVMAGNNATLQIGQETYYRIKASAAITDGQVVMFTGTVGNSGGLKGAPATGLTASTASYVMGVATQNMALNDWGYVTAFGLVRQINTLGGAEAWVDGTILYLDPSVAGGLTKNLPAAPNPKVQVAAVVHAASNGSLFIRPTFGGELGQYEGNVQITTPTGGQLLTYNQTNGFWKNTSLSAGTGISVSPAADGGLTVTNTSPSLGGTVTSVGGTGTVSGLTLTGTVTGSGNLTLGGTITGFATSGANTDITSVALTTGTISTAPSAGTDIVNKTYADGLAAKWGA